MEASLGRVNNQQPTITNCKQACQSTTIKPMSKLNHAVTNVGRCTYTDILLKQQVYHTSQARCHHFSPSPQPLREPFHHKHDMNPEHAPSRVLATGDGRHS